MKARRARGAAAVEFAVVSALFFTVLIGVMEMGRLLWTWNAAVEATRLGARLAVVCDMYDSSIRDRMIERLPALSATNITISYLNPPFADNTCSPASCQAVRVSLTNFTHDTVIPFSPVSIPLPAFSTTLRKEYMNSAGNPVCN
jgi:Flp pilus assembly protein TadG